MRRFQPGSPPGFFYVGRVDPSRRWSAGQGLDKDVVCRAATVGTHGARPANSRLSGETLMPRLVFPAWTQISYGAEGAIF